MSCASSVAGTTALYLDDDESQWASDEATAGGAYGARDGTPGTRSAPGESSYEIPMHSLYVQDGLSSHFSLDESFRGGDQLSVGFMPSVADASRSSQQPFAFAGGKSPTPKSPVKSPTPFAAAAAQALKSPTPKSPTPSFPMTGVPSSGGFGPGTQWYYVDSANVIQGPFAQDRMRQWNERGLFPAELLLQANGADPDKFVALSIMYPDSGKAFL